MYPDKAPGKTLGYSLLEISVSMLLFGVILMLSATTLVGMLEQKKSIGDHADVYQLAQNLMETLLAMPVSEAKAMSYEESPKWTRNGRYKVETTWETYQANPDFEKLTVQYMKQETPIIRLSTLRPVGN